MSDNLLNQLGTTTYKTYTPEEIRRLGVTDFNFLDYNAGDVVKAATLNADTNAGLWALGKVALGVAALNPGTAVVGGLGFLAMNYGHDMYQLWKAGGKDTDSFWKDYFGKLDEAAKEDNFFRDAVEGFHLGSSPMLGRAADTLPTSKGIGYVVGSIPGMLARDAAAYQVGGAKYGMNMLIGSMAFSEALSTGAYETALDDDVVGAIWPALSAGASTAITGHLFLNKIGPFLKEKMARVTVDGVLGTTMHAGVQGAEFAGWSASTQVMEGILNGDIGEQLSLAEIGYSAMFGAVLGGVTRHMENLKPTPKETPNPSQLEPTKEPLMIEYNPFEITPRRVLVTPYRGAVELTDNDIIRYGVSELEQLRFADEMGAINLDGTTKQYLRGILEQKKAAMGVGENILNDIDDSLISAKAMTLYDIAASRPLTEPQAAFIARMSAGKAVADPYANISDIGIATLREAGNDAFVMQNADMVLKAIEGRMPNADTDSFRKIFTEQRMQDVFQPIVTQEVKGDVATVTSMLPVPYINKKAMSLKPVNREAYLNTINESFKLGKNAVDAEIAGSRKIATVERDAFVGTERPTPIPEIDMATDIQVTDAHRTLIQSILENDKKLANLDDKEYVYKQLKKRGKAVLEKESYPDDATKRKAIADFDAALSFEHAQRRLEAHMEKVTANPNVTPEEVTAGISTYNDSIKKIRAEILNGGKKK